MKRKEAGTPSSTPNLDHTALPQGKRSPETPRPGPPSVRAPWAEQANPRGEKAVGGLQVGGVGVAGSDCQWAQHFLGGSNENAPELVATAAQVCEYTQDHWRIRLKVVSVVTFTACDF